jgi:L-iditol 2-dehydrogenase
MPDHLGVEEGVSARNVGISVEAVRRARIDVGDSVAVIGVGLLRIIILQLAKTSGAGRTIAVGRGHRLKIASKLGADEKVDRTQGDMVKQVRELTGGIGADVVIECAGAEEAVQQSLDCVRKGRRVVWAGLTVSKGVLLDTNRTPLDEIEVVGTRGTPNALPESINLLACGRINIKPRVSHHLPLSEVQRGREIFSNRLENVIRVALIP